MRTRALVLVIIIVAVVLGGLLLWCWLGSGPKPGQVKDEALLAGREAKSFPAADEDYFKDMDYGVSQNAEEVRAGLAPYLPRLTADQAVQHFVRGRNNW